MALFMVNKRLEESYDALMHSSSWHYNETNHDFPFCGCHIFLHILQMTMRQRTPRSLTCSPPAERLRQWHRWLRTKDSTDLPPCFRCGNWIDYFPEPCRAGKIRRLLPSNKIVLSLHGKNLKNWVQLTKAVACSKAYEDCMQSKLKMKNAYPLQPPHENYIIAQIKRME